MMHFKEEAKASPKARRDKASNAGLVDIQIQYRSVNDLALDPRNPRQHSQQQVNQIADRGALPRYRGVDASVVQRVIGA